MSQEQTSHTEHSQVINPTYHAHTEYTVWRKGQWWRGQSQNTRHCLLNKPVTDSLDYSGSDLWEPVYLTKSLFEIGLDQCLFIYFSVCLYYQYHKVIRGKWLEILRCTERNFHSNVFTFLTLGVNLHSKCINKTWGLWDCGPVNSIYLSFY